MCGDGADDAPALRQAQIGVDVSTATDVAKSPAVMVLTEPGLGGIVAAVQKGRVIFQRVLTYTLNSITKEIAQALFIAVGLIMTGHAVLTPLLMALIMIVGDALGMALATDNVRPSARPARWRVGRMTAAASMGLAQLGLSVAILATGYNIMRLDERSLQTLGFVTILCGAPASTYANRERRRLWSSTPSPWLIGATVADIGLAGGLALAGVAMAPLLLAGVAAAAGSAAFAAPIGFAKAPAFRRLAFA